ncbi:FecCD family ABC transporter permease [Clavibacter sepedonicus]|uniref:Iron-siderophore uptake system transmembrane component n=1 Tax=Clavibacter sepedonicus TaxID=31964 RepID=B0RDK3_CLASE|nr:MULTISPECIES: iron chelate uptake ABC transporter family permease subunit [Clavibacter]MBD5382530.1 iron chelate uptake ABC transporter family permease subunit [Clavibacter sp.]OQJ48559.1 iron ABC transporter permease [Clavibacter sepedonicus]OQJ54104.1 iron ABC transporter permease [Clavibacter sepedonicus]UUK65637.1 iron chelate uptake ABC transporter family permease subunit [Clavibacter sepedonicus]CAQ03132.1 putative iron-siderophore uptake system transmembrane component [Clavibacter se
MSARARADAGRRPAARIPGTVRLPVVGIRLQRREVLVGAALAVAILALALVALGTGDFPLTVPEVIRAMLLPDGSFASTIVLEWRLPRVLAAFGAALGVAGAVFQSLTRNPLGSPDVIGFSTGAYTGALIVTTLAGATFLPTAIGALAGGLGTALVVYLLAYRGGVQGFRLIITGIAVTAVLHGVNTFLLLKAGTEVAMAASIWGAGSLALVGWDRALPAFVALLVLAPAILLLSAPLRQLELGDDAARAHGVRAEPTRLALLILGVALTAVVTAASGPIAFVALAAPQIARRLTRSAGLPLVPAALTGGLLLLAADFAAQHALPGTVPVGIVTVVVGGAYLIALLIREASRRA